MLTPTELRALCERFYLRPSKAYGQNYLVQERPIQDMLAAGDLTVEDTVIEVGPGFGVLTFPLVERVKQVYSFEIEKKLEAYWEEHAKNNLRIIWGNALHHFPSLVKDLPKKYKILANLPYQITSNILRTFLEAEQPAERIVVMVQKEVAERICAVPGDMSLLSVSVRYYGTPNIISIVKRGNFFPAPKVDSAILQITNIRAKQSVDDSFFRIVKAGFSNKRKQLAKNVANIFHKEKKDIMDILESMELSPTIRAEALSMEDWKVFVEYMKKIM